MGISLSAGTPELGDKNGFTPDEVSRGGEAAAAVAAVVAAASAGKSGLRGGAQGRSQRLGPRGRPGQAPDNCAACGGW